MIKNIIVGKLYDETRIDRWLKRKYSSLNQSFIEKQLRKGIIKVNNNKIKANYMVLKGDKISIYGYLKTNYSNKPQKISNKRFPKEILKEFKSSILFENSDFFILNKWTGISTQGESKILISIDDIIKYFSINYNLVHRLDKETSGLLIIAKNFKATKLFGNLFKEQKIKKIYIALCHGIPKNKDSIVKLGIENKEKNIKKTETITQYKNIQIQDKISLNLLAPITGKKHQLRIIAKYLNCPIIGDNKYSINHKFKLEKLKLNACYLKFNFKDKDYTFKSILPLHFIKFLKKHNFNITLTKHLESLSKFI